MSLAALLAVAHGLSPVRGYQCTGGVHYTVPLTLNGSHGFGRCVCVLCAREQYWQNARACGTRLALVVVLLVGGMVVPQELCGRFDSD